MSTASAAEPAITPPDAEVSQGDGQKPDAERCSVELDRLMDELRLSWRDLSDTANKIVQDHPAAALAAAFVAGVCIAKIFGRRS